MLKDERERGNSGSKVTSAMDRTKSSYSFEGNPIETTLTAGDGR